MNKLIKPLGFLALIILICTVVVRTFSGAETLADYAEKSPIAYVTPLQTPNTDMIGSPSPTHAILPTDTPSPEQRAFSGPAEDQQIYQPGFYQEPLSENLTAYISGVSFPISTEEAEALAGQGDAGPAVNTVADVNTIAVTYQELRHLVVLYYDFNGEVQEGELICNQSIADDLLEIFHELYQNKYPIEKIRLIEAYDGDDTLSMLDNNTSGFNYRVVDGTSSLSKHALGRAIDINPFYNPYVVFRKDGSTYISPKGSEVYTDRSQDFPYKIDENDLCCQLFKQHGFTWGGDWNTMKDYQHFQK